MRALIVDDSRAMRMVIGRIVADLGVETLFAGNGKEALAQLEASGRPDFCLVDWNMPEMDGLEFVRAVRASEQWAGVPLLMVTTETEMAQVVCALEAGASEYVMKPFTADILREKLDMLGLVPSAG